VRTCSLTSICAGILMHSTLLSAQTYVVVIKVQTRDVINPNAEVITLASGARISVPTTDIRYSSCPDSKQRGCHKAQMCKRLAE
jgi:hypothetical protein